MYNGLFVSSCVRARARVNVRPTGYFACITVKRLNFPERPYTVLSWIYSPQQKLDNLTQFFPWDKHEPAVWYIQYINYSAGIDTVSRFNLTLWNMTDSAFIQHISSFYQELNYCPRNSTHTHTCVYNRLVASQVTWTQLWNLIRNRIKLHILHWYS